MYRVTYKHHVCHLMLGIFCTCLHAISYSYMQYNLDCFTDWLIRLLYTIKGRKYLIKWFLALVPFYSTCVILILQSYFTICALCVKRHCDKIYYYKLYTNFKSFVILSRLCSDYQSCFFKCCFFAEFSSLLCCKTLQSLMMGLVAINVCCHAQDNKHWHSQPFLLLILVLKIIHRCHTPL